MIYGLTVQKTGSFFEFRCPECGWDLAYQPLKRELRPRLRIFCTTHPDNFGEWASEAEMQREKLELAKRIGLLE